MYMSYIPRCTCGTVRDVHLVLHDMHISYIGKLRPPMHSNTINDTKGSMSRTTASVDVT